MSRLGHLEKTFTSVGWFIPPYMTLGALGALDAEIHAAKGQFTQDDLERACARLYEPEGLATMVLYRYPVVPFLQYYKDTIAEAIEAHFIGLHHVAAGGLAPVVEGAGRGLATQRGLARGSVGEMFGALAESCKNESRAQNIGAPDEIESMMDSFGSFAKKAFFASSESYAFGDGTNRHGIAHGAFKDADYGRPINFYKVIAAIDFLSLVASFRASISWLAPHTIES
jgi:hypothetical protein